MISFGRKSIYLWEHWGRGDVHVQAASLRLPRDVVVDEAPWPVGLGAEVRGRDVSHSGALLDLDVGTID